MNLIQQIKKLKQLKKILDLTTNDNKILYYNKGKKIHKKQLEFAKCPKHNRWVFGGNRSGKTECGAVEAVWMSRGTHPYKKNRPNCSGWIVSLSKNISRDVVQSKVLSYLNPKWIQSVVMFSGSASNYKNGIIDFINVYNVYGGISRIGFKSCEMGRDKFQGMSLDWVWFDEEPPKDIYDECRMRVLDRCGYIWCTMTPLLGLSWVYYQIYLNASSDSDIFTITMEWNDNPYLDKQAIDNLNSTMSADELEQRRYGKFRAATGLVYTEFCEQVHCIDPFTVPKEWYNNLSIDPGLNNPLSCHWYAVDHDGVVYVIAEHYKANQDILYHANAIKTISESLNWHSNRQGGLDAIIDSTASQHTLANTKSIAELFYQHGIYVNTKVDKNLFSGISRVKQYLKLNNGKPKIYIFKNCTNLIRELKSYWWAKDDIPKKTDDHALDELRYFLMSLPYDNTSNSANCKATKDNIVQMHKQRLLNKRKK